QVSKGRFREDLFFRLNVVSIPVPPLRARKEDIILLTQAFLKDFSTENSKELKPLTDEALQLLRSYSWPGNVRELRTSIEHGVVMCNDTRIGVKHLPHFLSSDALGSSSLPTANESSQEKDEKSLATDEQFNLHVREQQTIERALTHTGNNRTDAARLLGISRRTLQRKLKQTS
ncbi:MAG: sigma-54-dependent Fis family transcriptional regulator, partial [Akkermansiaceae bacterium]|nr:sigma-54-dependent Fis family transcriptional regulator [Akkermansiaceae bacterium]